MLNDISYILPSFPIRKVNAELKMFMYSRSVQFDNIKTSEIVNTTLLANSVGIKTFRVEIIPLNQEKNKINNYKNFAVEVIDQKTNIAIVYDQLHPDLGVLKKAIESNEQRNVSILKPNEYLNQINDFQLVILYQPNNNFNTILNEIKRQNLNTFIITGSGTDYEFINNTHLKVLWEISNQTEDFQPELNNALSFELAFGLAVDDSSGTALPGEFFVRDAGLVMETKVSEDDIDATVDFGLIKGGVVDGSIELLAQLQLPSVWCCA